MVLCHERETHRNIDDKAWKWECKVRNFFISSIFKFFIIIHLLIGLLSLYSLSLIHWLRNSNFFIFFFLAAPSSLYSLFCPPATSQIRSHLYYIYVSLPASPLRERPPWTLGGLFPIYLMLPKKMMELVSHWIKYWR